MKKKNQKYGWCIIIYGFSGSGKSTISKKIKKDIEKILGTTILLDGDHLRKVFKNVGLKYGYTRKERDRAVIPKIELFKLILENNINIIYPTVMLGHSKNIIKKWDREIKNLFKIYIKTEIKQIIRLGEKKKFYSQKNVVGIDIKPNFPKKPDIIINNNYKKNINQISKDIILKIRKKFK